jgi:hypothetical protein
MHDGGNVGSDGDGACAWELEELIPSPSVNKSGADEGVGNSNSTINQVISIALDVMSMTDLKPTTVLMDAGLDSMTSVLLVDRLVRCAFSTEIYTRGWHWFPRLRA